MIVDDEPVIRRGLTSFIPWQELGCKVVCLALDGKDALEKFKKYKPDIVVSDIKMPEMDGIELSKFIYLNHPATKVILLTAYSDFNFAQSAIKYGVVDFVLKPTSSEKLIEALDKAKAIIDDEKSKSSKINILENELSVTKQELQESFILKVINRVITESSIIINKADSLGIKLYNYYAVIIGTSKKDRHSISEEGSQNQVSEIKNLIPVVLKDYKYFCVIINNRCLCIFINLQKTDSCQNAQNIIDICNEILHSVNSLVDANISIGISNLKDSIKDISEAYEESREALSQKFFVDKNIFIYTGYKGINDPEIVLSINRYFDSLLKHVQSGEYNLAVNDLGSMFDIYKNNNISISDTKNISMLLYSYILASLPVQNEAYLKRINTGSKILESQSVEEIYRILISTVYMVTKETKKPGSYSQSIIDIINKYIEENYGMDINLASIAKYVHLNSSYLSRLYKKETGETLSEKIAKVRIQKAKELLKNTDFKIYEISSKVGIENTNYFSILFKKYTSMYPKDYRTLSNRK